MSSADSPPPMLHPPAEALDALADGTLSPVERALLEAHLAHCPLCRRRATPAETIGGRQLATVAPVAPPDDLLDQVLARLDATPSDPLADWPVPPAARDEIDLDRPLDWQSLSTDCRFAELAADDLDQVLYLVETEPEAVMPRHRHLGGERLVVLQGALDDPWGPMMLGDYRHYPAGTDHAPVMGTGVSCVGLILVRGGLEFF
ncbi:MAG: cupin domain-containing protein [Acidobacteriota bacterium]